MKWNLPKPLTRIITVLLLLVSSDAFASHIVGVELFYTYLGGNNYNITLNVYGDCGPLSAASFALLPTSAPVVCIYDGSTSISSVTLAIQPPSLGVEITPVCPRDTDSTQCTNMSYAIPGIKKFVYTGTYTVPYRSATWRFIFAGNMGPTPSGGTSAAGRAAAITNILPNTTIQIEDTLNNTMYNNSNAIMTTVPTPFFCLNNNDSYSPGAVDPDGDSLSFSLIAGINGTGNCSILGSPVTYNAPFTPAAPLDVVPGSFTFDQNTGQLSFVPDILQRALVVYNAEEYRAGTFVGSSQREMTFLVITCTDIPPSGSFTNTTAGTIGDSTHFYICSDSGAFTLYVNPTEQNTSNQITVTASGIPAGATYNVENNETNHPTFSINWNTDSTVPGTYIYYLTYKDNACPLSGTLTQAFTIVVLPLPDITAVGGYLDCTGRPALLYATGGDQYSWAPPTGLVCPGCDSNFVVGLVNSTLYTVTGTDVNGCKNTDTASILVKNTPANFLQDVTPSQTISYGSSIQLNSDGATYYYWTPDNGTLSNTNINNPVATPFQNTTYEVYAYNAFGCVDSAQVTISISTSPELIPSAFTPNGDDINDVFRVVNLGKSHIVDMRIFDRWGQQLFQAADNRGWDGTYQGKPQDMGAYFYYIIVEHEDYTKTNYKGNVTLIR